MFLFGYTLLLSTAVYTYVIITVAKIKPTYLKIYLCNKNILENIALNGVDKFIINNILATSEYSKAKILNTFATTSIAPDIEAPTYSLHVSEFLNDF